MPASRQLLRALNLISTPCFLSFAAAVCCLASSVVAGDIVFNVDPNTVNRRNSEGAFATLEDGRIRFCYSQFYGGAGDHNPARLVGLESSDEGRTWSAPRIVLNNEGGVNVMSVSLLRLQSGKLALFYLRKNSWIDCRPWMRTSSDEGKTWSEPVLVVAAPGYFVLHEDDPDGWYCYTAIHFVGDAVLLGYCAGDNKVGGLNRLRIRRIELPWLKSQETNHEK